MIVFLFVFFRNVPFSPPSTSSGSQQKVSQVQQQVQQVTDIMQENITKILDRGQKLDHLEDRSGNLIFLKQAI